MLELFFFVVAMALGGGGGTEPESLVFEPPAKAPSDVQATAIVRAPEPDPPSFETEDQTPTGKFTKAVEVKPILTATRGNWVAVRDFNGQDLLYFTHLLAWRCGLVALHYEVNREGLKPFPLPECHLDTNAPNALLDSDGLPYISLPRGSVEHVRVEIIYDDGTTDRADFDRKTIQMP